VRALRTDAMPNDPVVARNVRRFMAVRSWSLARPARGCTIFHPVWDAVLAIAKSPRRR
jgi:hypothetical protein